MSSEAARTASLAGGVVTGRDVSAIAVEAAAAAGLDTEIICFCRVARSEQVCFTISVFGSH